MALSLPSVSTCGPPQAEDPGLDELAQILREHSLTIGPNETLVIQMGPQYTPRQLDDVARGLRDLPYSVLVIPGVSVGKVNSSVIEDAVRKILGEELRKRDLESKQDLERKIRRGRIGSALR